MRERKDKYTIQKTPNKFRRYSNLKEGKHNSLFFECELHMMTSFHKIQFRKGRKKYLTSLWRNLAKSTSAT